jgi:peroxiredoxin
MASAVVVVGGVLLAGVFAAAGIAKLADLGGSRTALAAFGVPRSLATPLGTLLPLAELATAGLLVVGVAGDSGILRAGALSALVLLALFCAGIALSLLRGRAPDCHCFGQLHSAPASGRTLVRNGALLTLAALVASGGDPVWTVAAGATAIAIAGLVAGPISRPRREESADTGLPLGAPAPAFELPSLEGRVVSLGELRAKGRPVMLVFTDAFCGPCLALAPDLAAWQRRHAEELTIAVIENRDGESATTADEHGRKNLLLQRESEVAKAYRAWGTPAAVLVGPEGAVASPVAGGAVEIEALVAENVTDHRPVQPVVVSRRPEPGLRGGRLIRRELLLRGAGAWAAASAGLAWPLRAVAGAKSGGGCPDRDRCGQECCGQRQRCRGRGANSRCACPEGDARYSEKCGRDCTNFLIDHDNCGGCVAEGHGAQCVGQPAGSACIEGICRFGDGECPGGCQAGDLCCQGRCVTAQANEDNCGGCGIRCTEGKRPTCCGGRCRDIATDWQNCGECFQRCSKDKPICLSFRDGGKFQGKCVDKCPGGLAECKSGNLRTCYRPSTQVCCGGKVHEKEDLPKGSTCCKKGDGGFFEPRSRRSGSGPSESPCPPPGAPPESVSPTSYWQCRDGNCICVLGPRPPCNQPREPVRARALRKLGFGGGNADW